MTAVLPYVFDFIASREKGSTVCFTWSAHSSAWSHGDIKCCCTRVPWGYPDRGKHAWSNSGLAMPSLPFPALF
ncbi:hypothetical protein GDO78_023327 [Eleutherodactylus coqui]|uniref:Uncharacterized protein n=1 Tax=Eleutherodactylus coqui TaxID=57060 RepID=A0A8J6B8D6_ELECQ|nr:hypothetical protein GDO78_023327 [Eleutherodactylus coqui]